MEAKIRLEHQLLAVETEHSVHAMLELAAPELEQSAERPGLHLALVIDRSGSMAGNKLDVAKRCAAFLAQHLAPTDELAVVTYESDVELVLPLVPVGQADAQAAIAGILPGGQTNLSGGWLKGREEIGRTSGQGPRRVLLLTDGLANVGVTDHGALVAMSGSALDEQVGTTTVGFGDDFDEELLTRMADAGGGRSYFAATPDEAPGIFQQEFEGLISVVAQNVSVEIRPTEKVELLGILNEYPSVGVPGGVQVQLGDAFGGERRRVVFELHVPELAALGVRKVADVVLRYVSVGEEIAAHELSIPVTVNMVSSDEAAAAGTDHEVTEEVVVLRAARAQDEAHRRADQGDFMARRTCSSGLPESSGNGRRVRHGPTTCFARPPGWRSPPRRWPPRRTR